MKFISLYNIIIESRLTDYKIQLKDDQLAQNIFSINDPKKEKMIIKWIKNGSIQYPKDIDIINKVYQIINIKGLDYNKFNNPQQILDQYNQLNQKLDYNPDNQKCFTNKVQLGKGVVVYDVRDDIEGLKAVRRAVDYNWGKDAYPWCLITPPMQNALTYWKRYNKIQKRICFKNGKLKAFCANDKLEIQWWDRQDNRKTLKEIVGVQDDSKAIQDMLNNMSKKDRNLYLSKYSNDPNILQKLANDKYYNVRFYVAKNPNCPINILQKLSNNKDYYVRLNVAKNPNCSINILQKLSNDNNYNVRGKVALNLNTPSNILQKLINDENQYVKYNVALNPNCPINILQKLSQDENSWVIQKVAKNPNCSISILQKLSNNKNYQVRYEVINNPNCPKEILQKLANDEDSWVRCNVASNSNCPINILQKLADDNNDQVRKSVAENPNIPSNILQKLINDENQYVREIAEQKLNKY